MTLENIAVIDLSSVGAASRATRILADYGARVVRVLPPLGRDRGYERPWHVYGADRDIERIRVDLRAAAGASVVRRLTSSADVLVESFRPGVADRLGIGPEALLAEQPRLVYCSTSGYGQHGPYARWAGHDLNYLGVGGFLAVCEPRADGGPPIPGTTLADAAGGGMHAVIAILAALVARNETGRGRHLDVAAVDGVIGLMALAIDEHLATGERPAPRSSMLTGRYAYYGTYRTRDDRWLTVAAIEARFFENLCRALGLAHLVAHQNDDERQDEIREEFARAFATRDRDDWICELAPLDTCVAPVLDVDEVAGDPHLSERGLLVEAHHPRRGRFSQLGPTLAGAPRLSGPRALPDDGDTTPHEVLHRAGFDDAEIGRLVDEGVVG